MFDSQVSRRSYSQSARHSTLKSYVSKQINHAMNASKKDDDYGRRGRASLGFGNSKRQNVLQRLMEKHSNTLAMMVMFLVIIIGLTAVYYIFSCAASLVSGSGATTVAYQSQPAAVMKSSKVLNAKLDELINGYQKAKQNTKGLTQSDLAKIDDISSELITGHCLSELSFKLPKTAQYTLLSHFTYFIGILAEGKHRLNQLNFATTFVTKDGTIIDTTQNNNFHQTYPKLGTDYGQCSLVTALVSKTQSLPQQSMPQSNERYSMQDEFSKTDEDVWKQYKHLFKGGNYDNYDAYQLIKLAKYDDELHQFHVATQIIPSLLYMHCSNAMDSTNFWDKDGKDTFVASVHDIISQLHMHGSIQLERQEFPAFDHSGNIVAIDTFKFKDDPMTYGVDYLTCPFVEKIVYYHNVDIKEQVKELIEDVSNEATFAFDSKVDVMMIEHCESATKALKKRKNRIEGTNIRESVYRDVFIGEFKSFVRKVAQNGIMGSSDYVITQEGGIMPVSSAYGMKYYQCPLVSLVAKEGNQDSFSGSEDDISRQQHQFDPKFGAEKFEKELNHEGINFNLDASIIVDHYLHKEDYEYHRALMHYLYVHHTDEMTELRKGGIDMQDELFEHITQYIETLTGPDFTIDDFPNKHAVFIEIQKGVPSVSILHETTPHDEDVRMKTIKSEFLTAVFKKALTQTVSDRDSIMDELERTHKK